MANQEKLHKVYAAEINSKLRYLDKKIEEMHRNNNIRRFVLCLKFQGDMINVTLFFKEENTWQNKLYR